jgi:hypothetical protein
MNEQSQLGIQCRRNILEALRLLASPDAQLEYQRQVPIADVSAEIFCQWANDSFWPKNDFIQSLFTAAEWAALVAFNAKFEAIRAQMPRILPGIEELTRSPLHRELADAANEALSAFPDEPPATKP